MANQIRILGLLGCAGLLLALCGAVYAQPVEERELRAPGEPASTAGQADEAAQPQPEEPARHQASGRTPAQAETEPPSNPSNEPPKPDNRTRYAQADEDSGNSDEDSDEEASANPRGEGTSLSQQAPQEDAATPSQNVAAFWFMIP